jgi:hypothetical protein
MRFIEAAQGTPEWLAARSGLCTASRFADAISTIGGMDEKQTTYVDAVMAGCTEKEAARIAGYAAVPKSDIIRRALAGEDTVRLSDTAIRYADDLALERISGEPLSEPVKTWVLERGHEMEARARMLYEARTGAFVTEAGLCVEGNFAYSTDGLVDDDGLIEIKALLDGTKVRELWKTGDVSEFIHQMMGGKWITGRKWCDFILYVPALANVGKDLYVKRIHRDDVFIDDMVGKLQRFERLMLDTEAFWRAP